MKKIIEKSLIFGIIIVIFVVGLFLYFKSLTLSNLINENQQILITQVEFSSKDGIAYINPQSYNDNG